MNMIEKFMNQVELTIKDLLEQKPKNDPISMLNHYVRQADKETEAVKQLIERQGQLLQKVRLDVKEVQEKLGERQAQLELAKLAEEPQLVEFAEKEVTALQNRLQLLEETEREVAAEFITLEQQYEQMKHEVESMKIRQMQLMSKENAKHAKEKMQQVGGHASSTIGEKAAEQIEKGVKEVLDEATLAQRLKALQSK